MRNDVARHAPTARIDGLLVAPMVGGGVECILGIQRDPVFGPMVMFGLGGVFVETLGEVALRSAPLTPEAALDMVSVRPHGVLLDQPPATMPALAPAQAPAGRPARRRWFGGFG
jgi:hypothetical protein